VLNGSARQVRHECAFIDCREVKIKSADIAKWAGVMRRSGIPQQ